MGSRRKELAKVEEEVEESGAHLGGNVADVDYDSIEFLFMITCANLVLCAPAS